MMNLKGTPHTRADWWRGSCNEEEVEEAEEEEEKESVASLCVNGRKWMEQ